MKTIIESTNIYKGRDGWQGDSMSSTDANGNVWNITTYKRRGGVYCYAKQGKSEARGMFSYDMFGGKKLENLATIEGQCNEKKVRDCHALGLAKFMELMEAEEAQQDINPLYVVGVGQIIFTNGFEEDHKRVIYEVTSPGHFKTVSIDGTTLKSDDRVKNYAEKFGIGVYYNEGETMPLEEVQELVNRATIATQQREEAAKIASNEAATERAEKIEKGKFILPTIPTGVSYIIVAESRYNESELQSDYHAYGTEEVIYLAWSTHSRNLFAEMRKACLNSDNEEIKRYSVAPVKPDENRENYSMGAGYYLGQSKYSGWIIKKSSVSVDGKGYGISLETLQIAAAEGRFLCGAVTIVEAQESINVAPVEVVKGKINIIAYGEKAIAVVGDTKPIKDLLKSLGGRFNFRLSCGVGWIFPKTKLEEVQKALSAPKQEETKDAAAGYINAVLKSNYENFNYAG